MLPEEEELADAGFGDAELRETADANLGVGVGAELPPVGRFLLGVTRLLRQRLLTDAEGESVPAVFFFLADHSQPEDAVDFEPMLHHGITEVGSRLWFVGEVATNARGVPCRPWIDAEAFNMATRLGVHRWAAVAFDPRPNPAMVTFYPKGISDGNSARTVPLDVANLRLEDIFEAIDHAHEHFLATPRAQRNGGIKVWEDAKQFRPVEQAEKQIQKIVHIGLQMAFPTCDVRPEQEGTTGRPDLEIHVPTGSPRGPKAARAMLELKVIRSYRSTGDSVSPKEVEEQVEEGVVQAASYRDEHAFPAAALCCFDMRKKPTGDACFSKVRILAQARSVECRQWPIFNNAKAYRKHLNVVAVAG